LIKLVSSCSTTLEALLVKLKLAAFVAAPPLGQTRCSCLPKHETAAQASFRLLLRSLRLLLASWSNKPKQLNVFSINLEVQLFVLLEASLL
jgi:hypothetical protein